MSVNYFIRLDDACPTFDQKRWATVEDILDEYDIQPIVSVVPNNKDQHLVKGRPIDHFWEIVNTWQSKGWIIGLHGYDHLYLTEESGFFPFQKRSEFAGLPLEKQREKIKKGIRIFLQNGIEPDCWVAPSHTFDENTLKALKLETNIRLVSDGLSFRCYKEYDFNWIPQQLWGFRKLPFGAWTICLHPNEMNPDQFEKLKNFLSTNYKFFADLRSIKSFRKRSFLDFVFERLFLLTYRIKHLND